MQLILLLGLMLASALAEVLSLGAIVPFLAILTDPMLTLQKPLIGKIVGTLGLTNAVDLRWSLTLLFVTAAVAAGMIRFALVYATAKFNFGIGHELCAEVYRRTLYQSYEVHVARNSSQIMGGLKKTDDAVIVLHYLFNTVSAVLAALFIIAALVFIDPLVATSALLCFAGIYVTVTVITKKRVAANSHVMNFGINSRMQTVQEGLGGIRDVLLDQAQPLFALRFKQIDWPVRQAQASISIIGSSPRFAVESLGMVLIALLAYYLTASGGGMAAAMPTLGALALGGQRLMPLLQQAYQGWIHVTGNRHLLVDAVELLQQPVAKEMQATVAKLPFEREIRLENVSFRYQPQLPTVLHEINLTIPKGARVGFVGTTGSGKSTLIDLLMGLLQPTDGQILVDDKPLTGTARFAWQRSIAHVPQAIFLADATISENIAFGIPLEQIDIARVRQAAQQAQIAEFIESHAEGYAAMVGERGIRLSGGQRQRIGIARALYKQAVVLVFDEATSALDNETETSVMQAVVSLGRDSTIFLIAHRLTTLQGCDLIYRLEKGHIVPAGTYQTLIAKPNLSLSEGDIPEG